MSDHNFHCNDCGWTGSKDSCVCLFEMSAAGNSDIQILCPNPDCLNDLNSQDNSDEHD